jgi:DNA polymerase (family 10)
MDMDWRWWHKARDKGVLCSINPDAHRIDHYAMVRHGMTLARKGWLRTEDIVNTRTLKDVTGLLKKKRDKFG